MDWLSLILILDKFDVILMMMLWVYLIGSYQWWSIQWWIVLVFWFSNDAGGWIDRYWYWTWAKNGIVLRMLWVDLIKFYQCWSIRLFIVLIFRFSNNAGRWIDFHCYRYWTILTWFLWWCCGFIWLEAINYGQLNDGLCWYFDFQMMQADGLIANDIYAG